MYKISCLVTLNCDKFQNLFFLSFFFFNKKSLFVTRVISEIEGHDTNKPFCVGNHVQNKNRGINRGNHMRLHLNQGFGKTYCMITVIVWKTVNNGLLCPKLCRFHAIFSHVICVVCRKRNCKNVSQLVITFADTLTVRE